MNYLLALILLILLVWLLFSYHYQLYSFLGLAFLYITVFEWPVFGTIPGIQPIGLLDIMFVGYTVVLVARNQKERRLYLPPLNSVVQSFLLFLIIVLGFPMVGIITAGYPVTYLTPGIRFIQWFLFLVLAFNLGYQSRLTFAHVFIVGFCALASHFAFALLQFIDYNSLGGLFADGYYFDTIHRKNYKRVTGLTSSPIQIAQFSSLFTLLSIPYLIGRKSYLAAISTGGMALILIVFSQTRAGLVTFVVGLLMIIILTPELPALKTVSIGMPVTVIGLLGLFSADIVPQRIFTVVDLVLKPGSISSLEVRLSLWQKAVEAYRHQGFFGSLVNANMANIALADNYYLQLLVQAGVSGPLVFLTLLLSLVAQYRQKTEWSHISIGVAIFSIGLSIANTTHNSFAIPYTQIVLWTALGILFHKKYDRVDTSLPR